MYNDLATEFHREYLILVNELDADAHHLIANVQEFDWTEYRPDYWLINGRSYPDTVKPTVDPALPQQPNSSLIEAAAGETILLRIINLGFQQHTLQILGLPFLVMGQDAQRVQGFHGEDLTYRKNALYFAPGQTVDVLLTDLRPGIYPIYNRDYHKNNNAGSSLGGMVSEVRVY